jgi:hypothetical protein
MEDKIGSLRSFLYATKADYQRVGHRAIQVGHNVLVFGGINASNDFVTTILRINCESILVDPLPNALIRLEEFSLFSYKDHLYLWGGFDPAGVPPRTCSLAINSSSSPGQTSNLSLRAATSPLPDRDTLRSSSQEGTC